MKVQNNLLELIFQLVSPIYRWLLDACMNARYSNYRVSPAKANLAKTNLDEIKKHLKK